VLKERKPVPSFLTALVEKRSVCQLATGAASRLAITAGIAKKLNRPTTMYDQFNKNNHVGCWISDF
jgi:hypothetical protein